MEMIHDFIHINYTTFLLVVFMIVFLMSNVSFEKRTTRLFMVSIATSLILVIVDSVESYTATLAEPTTLRILMSAIGYTLRPMSILCVLLIITRAREINRILLFAPVVVNFVVSFSAFFSDIAYSYDANNEFVRGPLGITTYITSAIYLIMLCWISVQYFIEKSYHEGLIVFAITFTSVLSIFLEVAFAFDGFINACIAVSVTFYYMYYLVLKFKNDPLTQVLNRHYFDLDVERNQNDVCAVVNVDLNDLKVINDTKGHEYGDQALVEITRCMKRKLIRKCRLYRVGGDEFCILCFDTAANVVPNLEKMIADIHEEIHNAGYTCAMGLAVRESDEDFERLLKRADDMMYKNKEKMKSSLL